MSKRLKKEDWVQFGLKMLAQSGPAVLKADTLATALKVSRGSFYWHFENLNAFHTALLDEWLQFATTGIVNEIEKTPAGEARLEQLLEIAHTSDPSLERGIRAWAASNPDVAAQVEVVDRLRVNYLSDVLCQAGWPREQAAERALLLYLSNLGRVAVSDSLAKSVSLIDLLASAKYTKP